MTNRCLHVAGAVAALLAPTLAAQSAERAKATVDCRPTEHKLVYECAVSLVGRKSGRPLDGATLVIGADMPSMAMAHNVRPVTAVPTGQPGRYRARVELEMHGEWALRLDVSGPTRDRIVRKLRFEPRQDHGKQMSHGDHASQAKHKEHASQ